jgi:hypothetical protein
MSFAIIERLKKCCLSAGFRSNRTITFKSVSVFDSADYVIELNTGGVAEWTKATVLKTVERKLRGFESYLLRH